MTKSLIIYQSTEELLGKHLQSNEWIMYSGKLTIYDKTSNPVVLKLKSEISDSFMSGLMEENKEFKGNSVSEVYGKLAYWYYKNGIRFQN